MLIEQIVELQWRGLSPLAKQALLLLVIFMTKQKSSRKIFEWVFIYHTAKMLHETMHLTSPYLEQIKYN